MSIDTIQSEYVFSLRKKRIYKKRPTSKSNLKSVCKFKKYPNGVYTIRLHLRL